MFEYVSGANFLGESIEWCGFALACFTLQALSLAVFTVFNIGMRAYHHHRSENTFKFTAHMTFKFIKGSYIKCNLQNFPQAILFF